MTSASIATGSDQIWLRLAPKDATRRALGPLEKTLVSAATFVLNFVKAKRDPMGRKLSPELDWIFLSLVFNESDFANCSQLTILLQGFAGTLRDFRDPVRSSCST
jgi:hypothetical protein